jgi:hypothetical protein
VVYLWFERLQAALNRLRGSSKVAGATTALPVAESEG